MEYYRFRFNPPTYNLVVRFRNLLQGRNLARYGVTLAELKEADQQDDDVEVSQEQRRPNPQRNAPYTVYEDKKVLLLQVRVSGRHWFTSCQSFRSSCQPNVSYSETLCSRNLDFNLFFYTVGLDYY